MRAARPEAHAHALRRKQPAMDLRERGLLRRSTASIQRSELIRKRDAIKIAAQSFSEHIPMGGYTGGWSVMLAANHSCASF